MKKSVTNNIDACHEMLADAFSASVLLEEIHWNMLQAEDHDPSTNRIRHQINAASIALRTALGPWERELGPADRVANQEQPKKELAK